MDKGTKVSFIPKKPFAQKIERSTRPMSLLLFLSFFIFFATLMSYGGLYLYHTNLKTVLDGKAKELDVAKKKADPAGAIEKAEELQTKINNAKNLLNKHVAPSRVFGFLEEVTLGSVVLRGFILEREDVEVGQAGAQGVGGVAQTASVSSFAIRTGGIAPGYASLAYQSDVLKKDMEDNPRIRSFSIANPVLDETGNVSFDLDIILRSSFLAYGGALEGDAVVEETAGIDEGQDQFATGKSEEEGVSNETSPASEPSSFLDKTSNFFKGLIGK